jgi:nucleotide-binding universal stress UspA family protein
MLPPRERMRDMNNIKRVLVVCRLTSQCGPVVEAAVNQARKFGAELYVLNVIHNPFGIEGWNLPLPSLEEDLRRLLEKTKKEMADLVAKEKREGMAVKELIREGKPVEEIERVVQEEKIDLLVLPAHEESRLEHFLFGRDNEDLIRRMPCSILLVKREPRPARGPWT